MNKQEQAFIEGLTKLTRETGIVIAGCGCCGSPFLGTEEEGYIINKKWRYIYDPDEYQEVRWTEDLS